MSRLRLRKLNRSILGRGTLKGRVMFIKSDDVCTRDLLSFVSGLSSPWRYAPEGSPHSSVVDLKVGQSYSREVCSKRLRARGVAWLFGCSVAMKVWCESKRLANLKSKWVSMLLLQAVQLNAVRPSVSQKKKVKLKEARGASFCQGICLKRARARQIYVERNGKDPRDKRR